MKRPRRTISSPAPRASERHCRGARSMRKSWAMWVISGAICGYILCFSAIIFRDRHRSRNATHAAAERGSKQHTWVSDSRELAIVVPTHDGDIARAVVSMKRWPTTCSLVTLTRVDLIVYHATITDTESILARVPDEAMVCFRNTKVVSANLTAEENVYPIGPSEQFYRIFLDKGVAAQFDSYDAIAVVEWDVIVAHESSFHRLHEAAFANSEPFWVKGSTLAGTEFHETAAVTDMWFILGHLNGNAIYNTSDPAFTEFVDYTFKRWKYDYPYDVALWASLSDFPYSWTLWQRFAHKFVSTNLIANVGFHDVGKEIVHDAISADTLFIHGSTEGGGGTTWAEKKQRKQGVEEIEDSCKEPCGTSGSELRGSAETSTICDATCRMDEYGEAGRFGGHLCGAGDPAKFGSACRTCYVDHEAALTKDWHLQSDVNPGTSNKHVIMCNTLRPPQALDCSPKCARQVDTICDQRCGSGHHGNLHCNWRGLGPTCRFCFNDPMAAHLADTIASTRGERVIMCDTHEPPTSSILDKPVKMDPATDSESSDRPGLQEEDPRASPAPQDLKNAIYTKNITRGQLCAFVPGYFEFLGETRVTIASVLHFMPGMRVVVSTSELDFHVFNNTVGHMPGVRVLNSTDVDIAATIADEMCGDGTKLIYYLSPGQFLSREFTVKDTHTISGDLVVTYTAVENIGEESALRAMATTILLGYHAPSFTYGTDLILPVETNMMLRDILSAAAIAEGRISDGGIKDGVKVEFEVIRAYMTTINTRHAAVKDKRFIPEVLAATSFYHNQEGVVFINPTQWSRDFLFQHVSVWDIPLVKPHFSCMTDLHLGLEGYDLTSPMEMRLDAFRFGARCERGFVSFDHNELKPKASVEFGPAVGKTMPDIKDYDISVMYRSFYGDAVLLDISLPTVIKNFPSAREVVVVVEERDGDLFRELVAPYQASSPFPIRVVTEPSLMDGHIQQKYSKLRGDLYCEGDYILHMDSDGVIYEPLTYDHIFHMGKPVLPYRRYREELPSGKHLSWCWRNGTSLAVGRDVVHEYSIFNTHVYPRIMYSAIRDFVEKKHGVSFATFMASRRGKCMTVKTLSRWTLEERNLLLSDFNLMGAYLWYFMHDAVHWMATDPLDQTPDEWRRDVTRYSWVCQANARHMPTDTEGQEHYIAVLRNVTTFDECVEFQERFTPRVV